jgi:hypothetical protein
MGADERVLWGSCHGGGAEPYDTMVDHVEPGFSCTCPSRRSPCKHALALLLLWARGQVAESVPPPRAGAWSARRARGSAGRPEQGGSSVGDAAEPGADRPGSGTGVDAEPPRAPSGDERDRGRDDRVERMFAGLTELDRWLDDRIRTGLADPALARYGTWDTLAARLVDAQAGSLANRVRRLAGLVGASSDWHDRVLAELGVLHLLAQAGRRLGSLPGPLADAVATATGWQVRQADVLAGVPDTDRWVVAGRSDTREDRIEVRRVWLRGAESGSWALVLSFAAYRQSLDTSLEVGTAFDGDLHRYPGPALRALVGMRHGDPIDGVVPPACSVAGACDQIGMLLAGEPWLDRVPVTVRAAVTPAGSGWLLTDDTGSLPLVRADRSSGGPGGDLATLVAVSAGQPVDLTVEWTPLGLVPLTVHLGDRVIDIGPRADASFVGAA